MQRLGGQFIGFLDDDDEWCPNKVERLLTGFNRDEVALVYCNYIEKNDLTGKSVVARFPEYTGCVFAELIVKNFIGSTSFPLLRTDALRVVGGFDPERFELMIELSKKLSAGLPHVRVDFYESEGNIYFGEMTFFHWGGFVPFEPAEWDEKFGEWIEL